MRDSMSTSQVVSKSRSIAVKAIGLLLLAVGVAEIATEVYEMISSGEIVIDVVGFIVGYLMIDGGVNLFRLRESGRRTILAVMYAYICLFLVSAIVGVIRSEYHLTVRMFTSIHELDNPYYYFLALAILALLPSLLVVFLSQKETKAVVGRPGQG
jgi:hypothetical protein